MSKIIEGNIEKCKACDCYFSYEEKELRRTLNPYYFILECPKCRQQIIMVLPSVGVEQEKERIVVEGEEKC